MKRDILTCLAVLFIAALLSAAAAQNARDVARRAFPSVVLLVMQDGNGQPLSLGSGFFVSDGVVATNLHVVRGASTGQAKIVGQTKTYPVAGLVAVDADADLVLLKVPDTKAPALQLAQGTDLAVGDLVYAVGNPEGLEGTFSQGIVSGIRMVGSDRLLQVTAPISPGSSGGPIFDNRGQVIGVAVATFSEGQNLNFAIPSSYLASLLKRLGELRPLSSERQSANNASAFGGTLGEKSTDAVFGVELTWDNALNGQFSFTVRNQLQSTIRNIHYVVVFLGSDGNAVDSFEGLTCPGATVLPNLAKRQTKSMWSPPWWTAGEKICSDMTVSDYVKNVTRQYQIRVLDFELVK
jgi:S1-C subfamily serine protease